MTETTTIRVYQHSETEKAILVHRNSISAEADRTGVWLPKAEITILEREHVKNPAFGTKPHIVEYLGWRLTIKLPAWLAKRKNLEGVQTP